MSTVPPPTPLQTWAAHPQTIASSSQRDESTSVQEPRAAKPPRDGFLDTVRSIALGRVIIWHAFGIPWISWIIATMPTMFFIAGSLLASTLDRKPLQVLYRARLKRLLVPYWFFGAIVLGFLSLVHLSSPRAATLIRLDQLLPWIFPFTDPTASAWEGGWASSPLWYLRAYTWLLLLSPLLRAAVRRFGAASLVVPIFATALIELWLHHPDAIPMNPGTWTWIMGELTLYAFFVMLGFLHYDGAFERLNPRALIEWGVIGIAGCSLWWAYFPAPSGVINHSFIGLLFVGIAWLAFFLLLRPVLSKATENAISGPVVYLFTRRAMSIYLWHSPSIAASYWLIDHFAPEAHVVSVLFPTVALLLIAVAATGWIEDVSAGKKAEFWPKRDGSIQWRSPIVGRERTSPSLWRRHGVGLAMGVVLALVASAIMVNPSSEVATNDPVSGDAVELPPAPSGSPGVADFGGGASDTATNDGTNLPPPPSGRPGVADFGDSGGSDTDDPAPAALASVTDASAVDVLNTWLEEFGVAGARVAVSYPDGTISSFASGEQRGEVLAVDDIIPLTSATKSVTAAIVLDMVDQGLLDLDAPLPALADAPSFDHDVTLRQVLDHSAGIAPYQESQGYEPSAELSALAAVELSAATPLQWEAGTQRGYSNSGYLTLGLLAEQVAGVPFVDLANEQVERLDLETMRMSNTVHQGWVGGAAGGMQGTVEDLAQWGAALFRDGNVISNEALQNMTSINDFGVGLGSFPACPCGTDDDGTKFYTSIGHNGGEVTVQFSPSDDLVIAVSLTESLWTPFLNELDVYELIARLRPVV